MSTKKKLLEAAAGAAGGDPVYVDDVFSTYLYAGNNASRTITNGIDLSGEGGMVWLKARSESQNHALYDTERGATKSIYSSTNGAEGTLSGVSAFNSNGFDLGTVWNSNNQDYVSWTFRKQPGFFDVVTYTGNGTNRTISHNLGCKPGLIIIKATSMSAGWMVGAGFTSTQYYRLALETSAAASGGGLANYNNYLSAEPTTTTFSLGNEGLGNANGQTYVAYLFANDAQDFGEDSDESIIKCGSFTTDGSGNATIDLGFEPQWLLWKASSATTDWFIHDTMRKFTADGVENLKANTSDAASDGTAYRINSTGFEVVSAGANQTRIYIAIRRPNKPASEFAATDLFKVAPRSNTSGADHAFVSNFPVDMGMARNVLSGTEMQIGARLTGDKYLETPTADAEATVSDWGGWDSMNSVSLGFSKSAESPVEKYGWMFRRAPGFFDITTYTGTGSTQTISHNLGVAPEMMIIKARDGAYEWQIWTSPLGIDSKFEFTNAAAGTGLWDDYTPTATNFKVIGNNNVNQGPPVTRNYIAYLFASASGISKIGKYTGTGSNIDVDCGFSAGARFVLIKRSDSTGDWYLYDSERGIVAGDDPYLFLNTTAAQVTNTDYIDPLSSGFTITSSAPAALNTSGGTYIFLAIA